jgi:hypothetical protein
MARSGAGGREMCEGEKCSQSPPAHSINGASKGLVPCNVLRFVDSQRDRAPIKDKSQRCKSARICGVSKEGKADP